MQCLLSFLCEQQLLRDCKNISPTAIYTGVRCIALKICSRTALSELMSKFNVPLDTIIGQLQRRALCQSFNVWPNAHLQGTNGHEPDLEFSRLESWSRDVSRPVFTSLGLGLGLETSESWSRSWSWNLRVLVSVLVLKPRSLGLGLGLSTLQSRSRSWSWSLLVRQIQTLGLKWHAVTRTKCCIHC